jgi:hypothetical protein
VDVVRLLRPDELGRGVDVTGVASRYPFKPFKCCCRTVHILTDQQLQVSSKKKRVYSALCALFLYPLFFLLFGLYASSSSSPPLSILCLDVRTCREVLNIPHLAVAAAALSSVCRSVGALG